MASLQKTRQAEQDLIEIWRYTFEKWGETQADAYLRKIEACFEKIGKGTAPLKLLPDNVRYIRCEHHFIFLLMDSKPIVIALLHEKMDMLARLKKRLG